MALSDPRGLSIAGTSTARACIAAAAATTTGVATATSVTQPAPMAVRRLIQLDAFLIIWARHLAIFLVCYYHVYKIPAWWATCTEH